MSKLTSERIQELVIAADRETLCKEMASLTEVERKNLAPAAIKFAADIDKYCSPSKEKDIPAEAKKLVELIRKKKYPDWRSPRWTSQLLIVGLCEADVLKFPHKHNIGWLRTDLKVMQQRMLQILDVRRPKWLADWLAWEWKQEFPIAGWYLERGLIRSGALPPNDSPEYYARMAMDDQVIQSEYVDVYDSLPLFKSRRAMLEADPDLFKHDIWRLLETDTIAFRYAHMGWPDLLIELCQAGKLDRAQLLARCIHGMSLPLSVTTLGGLAKFHDQLSPSIAERQTLLQGYLRLLHQNHAGVVSLAIGALEKLNRVDQLPLADFVQHVPAVFTLEKKGAVKSALKLADSLGWKHREDEQRLQVMRAIVGGLQHADPDIQRAVLESMGWHLEVIDASLAETIAAQVETVAAAVKPELKKLLAKLGGSSPASSVAPADVATQSAEAKTQGGTKAKDSTKKSSAASTKPKSTEAAPALSSNHSADAYGDVSEVFRQRSHLIAALQSSQQSLKPVVLPIAPHHPPRRDPERAIQPIADIDELIATVSSVLQNVDDVMQLERCLDGILRFHLSPPTDFQQRSAALHKIVKTRVEKYDHSFDLLTDIGFTSVVAAWLKIPRPHFNWRGNWYEMRYWFLRARCNEVRYRIEEVSDYEKCCPLLALPTHADGWIDPEVLVARINESYAKDRILLGDHDLTQALLRLTPEGRSQALKQLGPPDHYNGGGDLQYALGADIDVTFNDRMSMVQLAAVRARMISLAEQNYEAALPIARARLDEQQRIVVSGALLEDPTVPFHLWEVALSYSPSTTDVLDPKHPYSWLDRWEALTNPMDCAADCLAGRTSHLLDPESTWTPEACRLAVLAASHERAEARTETTDAIIEAIARLLVIPEVFGRAIAENLAHIKLNRLAKVLADAAHPDAIHHWIILQSLETCITRLPSLPSDIHLLLTQMLESATTLELGLDQATLDKLSSIDAKSKSGKLAKQLSKLETSDRALKPIHEAFIAATATRARRWQSRM